MSNGKRGRDERVSDRTNACLRVFFFRQTGREGQQSVMQQSRGQEEKKQKTKDEEEKGSNGNVEVAKGSAER